MPTQPATPSLAPFMVMSDGSDQILFMAESGDMVWLTRDTDTAPVLTDRQAAVAASLLELARSRVDAEQVRRL